jgi:acetoin utilization deacetylase AcuC-like enzyme
MAFRPDILIVSLGFDTLTGDPVGGFCLQPATFQLIGRRLISLERPLVLVQEGGYLLPALAPALEALVAGIVSP